MVKQAIEKLQSEIDKNQSNAFVGMIGLYMINLINSNEEYAGLVLDEKKTLLGSLKAMEEVAKKKKVGNMAVLTPNEGYDVVHKYFGIGGKQASNEQVAVIETPTVRTEKKKIAFDDLF